MLFLYTNKLIVKVGNEGFYILFQDNDFLMVAYAISMTSGENMGKTQKLKEILFPTKIILMHHLIVKLLLFKKTTMT